MTYLVQYSVSSSIGSLDTFQMECLSLFCVSYHYEALTACVLADVRLTRAGDRGAQAAETFDVGSYGSLCERITSAIFSKRIRSRVRKEF